MNKFITEQNISEVILKSIKKKIINSEYGKLYSEYSKGESGENR